MHIFKRIEKTISYRSRGIKLKRLQREADRIRHGAESFLRTSRLVASDQIPFTIACLVGKRQIVDLLFTLLSFERAVGSIGSLTILSDGTLDDTDVSFFSSWIDTCHVFLTIEDLCKFYSYEPESVLLNFYNSGYFGAAKFLLLNIVNSKEDCMMLDSDVIFFKNPLNYKSDLKQYISQKICTCLEDDLESYDPSIIKFGKTNGREIPKTLNAGLVYVPKNIFTHIDWNEHIPFSTIRKPHIFAEQSALASGLSQVGYEYLDKDSYVVSSQGAVFPHPESDYHPYIDIKKPYKELVCRHFVTPVRHLMWTKAFPLLRDKF